MFLLVAFVYIINGLGGMEQAGKVPARITEKGIIVQDYQFDKTTKELVKNKKPKPIGQLTICAKKTRQLNASSEGICFTES